MLTESKKNWYCILCSLVHSEPPHLSLMSEITSVTHPHQAPGPAADCIDCIDLTSDDYAAHPPSDPAAAPAEASGVAALGPVASVPSPQAFGPAPSSFIAQEEAAPEREFSGQPTEVWANPISVVPAIGEGYLCDPNDPLVAAPMRKPRYLILRICSVIVAGLLMGFGMCKVTAVWGRGTAEGGDGVGRQHSSPLPCGLPPSPPLSMNARAA